MPVLNLFKIGLAFALASLIVGVATLAGLFWHFSHGPSPSAQPVISGCLSRWP